MNATLPKTRGQWDRFNAACRQKRAEDRAKWQEAVKNDAPLRPRQMVVYNNANKLSRILERITVRAIKTGNDDLQRMLLDGIQHMGKDAARIEKRMKEEFI